MLLLGNRKRADVIYNVKSSKVFSKLKLWDLEWETLIFEYLKFKQSRGYCMLPTRCKTLSTTQIIITANKVKIRLVLNRTRQMQYNIFWNKWKHYSNPRSSLKPFWWFINIIMAKNLEMYKKGITVKFLMIQGQIEKFFM